MAIPAGSKFVRVVRIRWSISAGERRAVNKEVTSRLMRESGLIDGARASLGERASGNQHRDGLM